MAETFGVGTVIAGQISVTTAGTAVQASADVENDAGFFVKALIANTGAVYVGNDGAGDVTSSNGYELSAGDQILIETQHLLDIWVDSAQDGDGVCWLKA